MKENTFLIIDWKLYDDPELVKIPRGIEIVALYKSFIKQYGKCDADLYYFCKKLSIPYPTFVKRIQTLKQLGYIPTDLFGSVGTIKRKLKSNGDPIDNLLEIQWKSNGDPIDYDVPLTSAPPKNNKNNNTESSPDGSLSENKNNKNNKEQGTGQYSEPDQSVINFKNKLKLNLDYNKIALLYLATVQPKDKIASGKIKEIIEISKQLTSSDRKNIIKLATSGAYFYDVYQELMFL